MKKTIFLFFYLVSFFSWSQEKAPIVNSKITYTSREGYQISIPFNAVYDGFGRLWIVGETTSTPNYVLGQQNKIIIQKFNGTSFTKINLPHKEREYIHASLFKCYNKKLYLVCNTKKTTYFFSVNSATSKFTEIQNFNLLNTKYQHIKLYNVKKHLRLFVLNKNQIIHQQLDGKSFSVIDSIPIQNNDKSLNLKKVITLTNGAVILNTNKKIILFTPEGKYDKTFYHKNINKSNSSLKTIALHYKINQTDYIIFKHSNDIYTYRPKKKQFTKVKDLQFPINPSETVYHYQKNNILYVLSKRKNVYKLHFLTLSENSLSEVSLLRTYTKPIITFRDPFKEILFVSNKKLTHFFLKDNNNIATFLSQYYITSVKELDSIHFLVKTKENGWHSINTKNFTQKPFTLNKENLFNSTEKKAKKIITNYKQNSLQIDSNLKSIFSKKVTSDAILTQYNGTPQKILIGTKYGKFYQFDTKNNTLKLLFTNKLQASIVGILVDANKKIWLNTYDGIFSYNPTSQKTTHFTKKDGILNLKGSLNSSFISSKGSFFMGSKKGLSYFNPATLKKNKLQLTPSFTAIGFFNAKKGIWEEKTTPKYLNNVKKITLPAVYQRYQVKFGILDLVNNTEFHYKFKVVGKHSENPNWTSLGRKKDISFANVDPGVYHLKIAAFSNSDQKIGKTLSLTIVSKTVFYKTWWFMTLVSILFILLLGYFIYQLYKYQKLDTKRKIAQKEAEIKDNMMREIHHRIKNNLQVISGLLNLQATNSNNKKLSSKLQDSQGRIEAIAGIHNILYSNNNTTATTVNDFFSNIISYNKQLFPLKINFKTQIDNATLQMEKANPLALILNELISNSYKHAFTNTKKPAITIQFYTKNTGFTFSYKDNGLYERKNQKNSLGMQIISLMSEELDGVLKIHKTSNFALTLSFRAQV